MSYSTRRSAGKRIRMDDYNEDNDGQDSSAMDTSNEAFDPIALYQQQRAAMLMESSQHVQTSQEEIQKAQLEAQQRDQMMASTQESGGRRSRSAAAAAKVRKFDVLNFFYWNYCGCIATATVWKNKKFSLI